MSFLLAYAAGLLTLINPCVLPVIPIAIASATSGRASGPIALAAGMSITFSIVGILVASVGPAIGLSESMITTAGAVLMIGFALVLLVPRANEAFATATAGFSGNADRLLDRFGGDHTAGAFLGGVLLGFVWSPCIGPTLGGAISLASQGGNLAYAFFIMAAFSLGVSTVILLLAFGAREAIRSRQQSMRALAEKSKPIMGWVFLSVGVMILFRFHHVIEAWLLDRMPLWLLSLSVSV